MTSLARFDTFYYRDGGGILCRESMVTDSKNNVWLG